MAGRPAGHGKPGLTPESSPDPDVMRRYLGARCAGDPSALVVSWRQLTLAVMTALAAVTLLAGAKSGKRPLSWRPIAAVAAVAAVLAAAPVVESAFTSVTTVTGQGSIISDPLFGIQGLLLADGLLAGPPDRRTAGPPDARITSRRERSFSAPAVSVTPLREVP
jgi:hypothetical protein